MREPMLSQAGSNVPSLGGDSESGRYFAQKQYQGFVVRYINALWILKGTSDLLNLLWGAYGSRIRIGWWESNQYQDLDQAMHDYHITYGMESGDIEIHFIRSIYQAILRSPFEEYQDIKSRLWQWRRDCHVAKMEEIARRLIPPFHQSPFLVSLGIRRLVVLGQISAREEVLAIAVQRPQIEHKDYSGAAFRMRHDDPLSLYCNQDFYDMCHTASKRGMKGLAPQR